MIKELVIKQISLVFCFLSIAHNDVISKNAIGSKNRVLNMSKKLQWNLRILVKWLGIQTILNDSDLSVRGFTHKYII